MTNERVRRMIEEKLTAEHHYLITDSLIDEAKQLDGDFDVVYFPPEGDEVLIEYYDGTFDGYLGVGGICSVEEARDLHPHWSGREIPNPKFKPARIEIRRCKSR